MFGLDGYFEFATYSPSKNAVIGGSKKKHAITAVYTSVGHCGEKQNDLNTISITILFDDGDEVNLNYILRRSYPKLKPLVLL